MAVFYTPFLIAFIISAMVEPVIKYVSKKTKMQRKPSAVIVIVAVFAVIVSLLIWGIAVLIDEGANFLKMLNQYVGNGYEYIMGLIDKLNFDEIQISEEVLNIIKNSTANFLDQVSKWVTNFLTSILSAVSQIGTVGIYTVITILATYFICADRIYILDQIEHHFPKDWVKKLSKNIRKIIALLGGYLKAQGILIGINFILVLIRTICIQNIWIKRIISITNGTTYSFLRCFANTTAQEQ